MSWSHVGVVLRLHKLQQKHEQRVAVAQRAQAATEDEVAWDDDLRVPSPAASPVQPARIGLPSPPKVPNVFQPHLKLTYILWSVWLVSIPTDL